MALLAFDNQGYCTFIDKFLSLVSRLNVLFVHPNWHDYPVFCRRINAEISFGYVRLSGRMKKLRYVWSISGFMRGAFYENEASSFSYFSTHPSAPHSLKISIALFRFFFAFGRSPFRLNKSA